MNYQLNWEIVRALRMPDRPPDIGERLCRFGLDEWMGGLPWLRRSGLELPFWDRLKASGAEQVLPPRVRSCIERDAAHNRQRLAAMREEFRFLINLLDKSRHTYAVLKGFALVPDYCPDPTLRNQYDFDVLVRVDDLPSTDADLRSAGFIRKRADLTSHPAVYHHADRKPHFPSRPDRIFSEDLHRSVEVHTRLWESETECIDLNWPGDPLRRSSRRAWEGISFPTLAPEDAMLFQVLHAFRHILNNWCRLSMFHEIALFLERRSSDERFWLAFRKLIQGHDRLYQCTGVVFSLVARLFGAQAPLAIREFSVDALTPAMALWTQRYGVTSAMNNFSADKFSLFLHRLFIDHSADWAEVRTRRLFPLHRPHMTVSLEDARGWRRWGALGKQAAHSGRRLWLHLTAGLRYMLEVPLWSLRLRAMSGKGTLPPRQNLASWAASAGGVGGIKE